MKAVRMEEKPVWELGEQRYLPRINKREQYLRWSTHGIEQIKTRQPSFDRCEKHSCHPGWALGDSLQETIWSNMRFTWWQYTHYVTWYGNLANGYPGNLQPTESSKNAAFHMHGDEFVYSYMSLLQTLYRAEWRTGIQDIYIYRN